MNPQYNIDYKLRVSKKAKRLSLRFDHHGLRIVSPRQITDKQAQDLISRNYQWIIDQQQSFESQKRTLGDGAEVEIFGDKDKIRYELAEASSKVTENGEFLIVKAPAGQHDKALQSWLRKIARKGIIARVEELAASHNFTYNNVAVRDQSSRWGSCSSQRNLSPNFASTMASMSSSVAGSSSS